MSFDWNWFFSSFCQSAAALIGIIAAFIISRLLGLGEKVNSVISSFDNLVIEFNRIVESTSNRNFYWYTKTRVKNDSDLADAIIRGEYENLNSDEICEKIYEEDSLLYKVDPAVMEGFQYLYDQYKPNGSNPPHRALLMVTPGIWDKLNDERELIDQLEIESKVTIKKFSQNLQDLNSFKGSILPLRYIILALMIAFPLTVIYPLHFMPVIANENPEVIFSPAIIFKSIFSLKFILLAIFFVSIEGIFLYFLYLTKEFEKTLNTAIANNSDTYRNINNYSTYFE